MQIVKCELLGEQVVWVLWQCIVWGEFVFGVCIIEEVFVEEFFVSCGFVCDVFIQFSFEKFVEVQCLCGVYIVGFIQDDVDQLYSFCGVFEQFVLFCVM